MKEIKKLLENNGITLISLAITIVVLVILSAVAIYLTLGNDGILNKAKQAKNETIKQTATEKMNLKITNIQIEKYTKEQRMPTLQEFADDLCEDNEIQYVQLQSKKEGSLSKIEVGEANSIFTKLKEYPYEFEINSSLQLASIDGIQVATGNTVIIPKEEYDQLKNANKYSTEEIEIGTWIDGKTLYRKVYNIITPATNKTDIIVEDISDLNIDYIIHIYGTVDRGSSIGEYPIGQYYSSGTLYAQAYTHDSNTKLYFGQNGMPSSPANIILEYTKKTDSAS